MGCTFTSLIVGLAACAGAPTRPPATPTTFTVEEHPYYMNFVPFGAGQFQNGQGMKGVSFAIAEGVTAASSAGIWLYLVDRYGLSNDEVPDQQSRRVRDLQVVEIGSGVAFLGLAAWGVIDSLVHYKPVVWVDSSPVAVVPTAGDGVGVSLVWSR